MRSRNTPTERSPSLHEPRLCVVAQGRKVVTLPEAPLQNSPCKARPNHPCTRSIHAFASATFFPVQRRGEVCMWIMVGLDQWIAIDGRAAQQ